MAELKNMTVQALRDLARKALGRGHSRLKTKTELVAALQAAGRNVSDRVKEATGRAAKAAGKVVARATTKKKAAAKAKPAKAAKAAKPAARPAAKARPPAKEKEWREVQPAEPDADGYFVARVAGEEAVRDAPHPMTESALEEQRRQPPEPRPAPRRPHEYDERLGELPWAYGDDSFVALPRDPRTLYLYWDHHADTLKNGFEGLEGGKAQIWVFARRDDGNWDRVRVLDFALESRSWYIHDLDPGRVYRAEIHVVDRQGRERLLPQPSNEMQLPPFGPSPVIDDKFLRIPWGTPLAKLLRHFREGAPFPDELRAVLAHLSDWTRFVGPTWGSGSGSAGGPGGRPTGPSGEGPWGPSGGGRSGEGR